MKANFLESIDFFTIPPFVLVNRKDAISSRVS